MDRFLYCCPVSLAVFRSAHNNQPIATAPGQDLSKCGDQVFEPLVRCDVTEKQNRPLSVIDAQSLLCLVRGEACVRNSIVDPERNDGDPGLLHAKLRDEFNLHLLRMNEDMVRKPILYSECKPIEERVFRISPACIHIVYC